MKAKRLGEGDGVFANLAGHPFTIGRQEDKSDFKYFIVDLPATL